MTRTSTLRTSSLRTRVLAMVLGVFTLVLVATVLVVGLLVTAQERRSVNTVLTDRVQLSRQLAAQGVTPRKLMDRVAQRSVRVRLDLPDGRSFGIIPDNLSGTENSVRRVVTLTGKGALSGARLTLVPDTALQSGTVNSLLKVLVITGIGALLITTIALIFAVRFALAPLDAMTTLARRISAGDRGRRLGPTRTDTELGRAALAFDEMLGALEGAESQARAAEQAARESERGTRRFVADAAHELRTPIAGMSAVAEAILGGELTEERSEQLRALLGRQSRLAGKLVDDLLDLARLDIGVQLDIAPVRLSDELNAEAERIRLLHRQIDVHVDCPAELIVLADAARVRQILAILLDNASQANGARGWIQLRAHRANQRVELDVTDSGPGVPDAERERIFDRLVRLDSARASRPDGSGLGLAIARGFARAQHGDLGCLPGTVFRLALPADPGTRPNAG